MRLPLKGNNYGGYRSHLSNMLGNLERKEQKYFQQKKGLRPEETVKQAGVANDDYHQAIYDRSQRNSGNSIQRDKWVPSPSSVFKINSDGAYNSSRSLPAFGVIVKYCGGLAKVWRCGRMMASSALMVEAWALSITFRLVA